MKSVKLRRRILDPLAQELGPLKTMRKSAKMTARIALGFAILCFVLLTVSILSFGVSPSSPLIVCFGLVFLAILAINYYKRVYVSSFLLCTLPSLLLLAITMILKSRMPGDDLHYFDSRIILLGFCALPGMIYSQREPAIMYTSIAIGFLSLALYDPIHEAFGLGYYQRGFTNPTYYHINTISMLIGLAIIGGSLILKRIVIHEEDKNVLLIDEKEQQNQELEAQNEEIISQTEQLTAALGLIEDQKRQLERYATRLEDIVEVKSRDLRKSNEELQKYNSELRQFSYTVSHNVRGPVARLLGLASLVNLSDDKMSDENKQLVELIKRSTNELDLVIHELSKIIDIRNDLYTVKEKVLFDEEWKHVYKSLEGQFNEDMHVMTNFQNAPFVFTIRPFLHSILYNLVSNAIRYRSPQRRLELTIVTSLAHGKIQIDVSDNGLGINLEQFGQNIFEMYKRFHTHVEGRGMGLYLVKTQTEALNGQISVKSELNQGTTFSVCLPVPTDIEGQLCYDSGFGTILYNARTNTMGLNWRRAVNSDEYRAMLTKCLEMLHVYRTPHWIADLRKRGNLSADDYRWFGDAILNEGSKNGLRRIACIDSAEEQMEQRVEMVKYASRFDIEMKFFGNLSSAEAWIESLEHANVAS